MNYDSKLFWVRAVWYLLGAGVSLIVRNAEYLQHCNEMTLLCIIAAGVWKER